MGITEGFLFGRLDVSKPEEIDPYEHMTYDAFLSQIKALSYRVLGYEITTHSRMNYLY